MGGVRRKRGEGAGEGKRCSSNLGRAVGARGGTGNRIIDGPLRGGVEQRRETIGGTKKGGRNWFAVSRTARLTRRCRGRGAGAIVGGEGRLR